MLPGSSSGLGDPWRRQETRLLRAPKWFHVKTVLTGSVCSPETQNSPSATWQGGRETSGLLTPSLAGAASFFPVLNTVKVCSNENSTAEKKYHKLFGRYPTTAPALGMAFTSPTSFSRIQEEAGATQSPPFPPPQTGQHPLFIPSHLFGPTTTAEHELGEASPIGRGSHRHTGPSSLVMGLDWGPEGFFRYRRGPPFPEES